MKVLKATQEQYAAINKYQDGPNRLEFLKDANNNWIVGKAVLNDLAYEDIKDELLLLEEIDFNPMVEIE